MFGWCVPVNDRARSVWDMTPMSTPLPPIYRECGRLLVYTEDMVRHFSLHHKYTVGTDLRQLAMAIMRTVNQTVYDKPRQSQHVQALVWRVDDYKITLQLSMDVVVFAYSPQCSAGQGRSGKGGLGFHIFQQEAILAAAFGKQCGGRGQALARRQCAAQAAPTVSTDNDVAASPARVAGSQPAPAVQAHPASLSGRAPSGPWGSLEPLGTGGQL